MGAGPGPDSRRRLPSEEVTHMDTAKISGLIALTAVAYLIAVRKGFHSVTLNVGG